MNDPINWLAELIHVVTRCTEHYSPDSIDYLNHVMQAAELWGHISERYDLKRPAPRGLQSLGLTRPRNCGIMESPGS